MASEAAAPSSRLFVRSLVRDAVLIKPRFLGSNFAEAVERSLKDQFEGVCTRHGYILPGSVEVHRILPGRVEAVSLNGDVRYDAEYFASVCNPAVGAVLEARVVNINQFGVAADSGVLHEDGTFLSVVSCIVLHQPVSGAVSEVDLAQLKPGDEVLVKVLGKRSKLGEKKISVIAVVVRTDDTEPRAASDHSGAVASDNVLADMQLLQRQQHERQLQRLRRRTARRVGSDAASSDSGGGGSDGEGEGEGDGDGDGEGEGEGEGDGASQASEDAENEAEAEEDGEADGEADGEGGSDVDDGQSESETRRKADSVGEGDDTKKISISITGGSGIGDGDGDDGMGGGGDEDGDISDGASGMGGGDADGYGDEFDA
jgi:DNA-directed RNA polymerase subunit E'/Rpb7